MKQKTKLFKGIQFCVNGETWTFYQDGSFDLYLVYTSKCGIEIKGINNKGGVLTS
jgi:hypothetical protein